MTSVKSFKPQVVPIGQTPGLGEKWLQNQIAADPKILGLGDLDLKDSERILPGGGGRLDLLLQDAETNRRYEVEIQLGKTDESHIIRTIEYWDIEKERYPHLDHCAVIVAEDITSRFLNVIKLFNRCIPLIAIKLQAIQIGEEIGLIFTTVLDELPRGLPPDPPPEKKSRPYWESKGSPKTVKLADRMLEIIHTFAPGFELNYNKHYIGLVLNDKSINFVVFRPQKTALRFEVALPKDEKTKAKLDGAGLEVLEYDAGFGYYKIRLSTEDIEKHKELLCDLMKEAYVARNS